jgi:hypothetical protein
VIETVEKIRTEIAAKQRRLQALSVFVQTMSKEPADDVMFVDIPGTRWACRIVRAAWRNTGGWMVHRGTGTSVYYRDWEAAMDLVIADGNTPQEVTFYGSLGAERYDLE